MKNELGSITKILSQRKKMGNRPAGFLTVREIVAEMKRDGAVSAHNEGVRKKLRELNDLGMLEVQNIQIFAIDGSVRRSPAYRVKGKQ